MEKRSYEDIKLPIGTICKLKNLDEKIMITVALPVFKDCIFDYGGCFYPIGEFEINKRQVFNSSDIEEIIFMGYETDEDKEFKNDLLDLIDWDNLEEQLKDTTTDEGSHKKGNSIINTDLFNTNK